ncbi:hypothetical protein ACIPW5_37745 [Streptomyces sp. NPDC090077]|uniref:hypothetical protein n=1 Tax=Streptomyces sp. NPDC090077 TaxID=3365938 RepID=UPI0038290BB0
MNKRAFAVVATSVIAASALAVPAASADTSGATGCWSANVSRAEGHGWANVCDSGSGSSVSGWIQDDKADGRCPWIRFKTAAGYSAGSPRVGPKGAVKNFSLATGSPIVSFNVEYDNC